MAAPPALKIKIQIHCGDEIAMGPGKADLLEAIIKHGSISGAGRALGMSYRRTWLLVDAMNRCWEKPLVGTAAGGSHGGGAQVTPFGHEVLEQYRALQAAAAQVSDGENWQALSAALRSEPKAAQQDQ
jgi:molybdate transport system regulatory protein